MKLEAVLAAYPQVQPVELTAWIERRWVRPDPDEQGGWVFRDVDVARVRLICELRLDLAIADDSLPLVLSLIDQLYETRHHLRRLVEATVTQPAEVRESILHAIELPTGRH